MSEDKSIVREYLEALLIAVIFAIFARAFVLQAFKIPSSSMEQNLLIGDHILVNKFMYGPAATPLERWLLPLRPVQRGDVVVFRYPEDPARDFIKRCVGLPGDEIRIVDKRLFINGQAIEDGSYTIHTDSNVYRSSRFLSRAYRNRDNFGPFTVPEGQYFCLGDNRDNSNDSRFWGTVPQKYVKGRAFMIYWSFENPEETERWPGFEGKLRQLGHVLSGFFRQTRWDRTFRIVR